MLTVILSLFAACGTFFALSFQNFYSGRTFYAAHPVWAFIFAVLAALLVQVVISLLVRRAANKLSLGLQAIMQEAQKKIQMKQNQFIRRPLSQDAMIHELEKEQFAGIDRMIEALDCYKVLYPWNLMMKRQVNSMRMMFYYQKREFDKVDELLPKCLLIDAQSIAMKMARMYEKKEDGKKLDKFYARKCIRFKGDEAVLLVSTYAWILVKQDRVEAAAKALAEAKIRTRDNPIVIKNWEMLVNGKIKHFSNSQIGDMWYALQLEKPKMPRMQQNYRYR